MNTLSTHHIERISAGTSQSEYMQLELEIANWLSSSSGYSTARDSARLAKYLSLRNMQMDNLRSPEPLR
ncbi:hypothetical protein [Aliiglaciecola litoralis]|uniref:Uncharacterized protein n=1 Tax=Aliiglaciecola litoralis TaxID=582857 RepID=A0ABP3X6S7_9ALTE